MALFELRQYTIYPGKMDEWLAVMEDEIIPFNIAQGMVVTASFRGEEDQSVYIWIRRFEDEAHREKLYEAVYESDHWKTVLLPKLGGLVDREAHHIQRIIPTRTSPMQ
ncbi:MAG: NIPSNAP family protein [Rhizobiales bacterium]|nr:NIPSNAP family protein [Hyphomicrobiales bacterium]